MPSHAASFCLQGAAFAGAITLSIAAPDGVSAQQPDRQSIGTFSIDRTEIAIRALAAFANATGLMTEVERAGGLRVGRRMDAARKVDLSHAPRHASRDGQRVGRTCHLG
jgi:prophage tail gpP-like protein